MSYQLKDVRYEDNKFVILKVPKGYEVYIKGATCMTRKSQIGLTGEEGLKKAIQMIEIGIIR